MFVSSARALLSHILSIYTIINIDLFNYTLRIFLQRLTHHIKLYPTENSALLFLAYGGKRKMIVYFAVVSNNRARVYFLETILFFYNLQEIRSYFFCVVASLRISHHRIVFVCFCIICDIIFKYIYRSLYSITQYYV